MDRTKDIAETELPISRNDTPVEFFTIMFQKAVYGCDMVMMWGDIKVVMPVDFS
jgi:hypothetical protein